MSMTGTSATGADTATGAGQLSAAPTTQRDLVSELRERLARAAQG